MTNGNISANQLLMGSGRSASFRTVGTTVAGVITEEPEVAQQRDFESGEPAFWDKDKTEPKMQLIITLQTQDRDPEDPHDDGVRKLYVASSNQRKAIAAAVRAAGKNGLAVGGVLSVTYTKDGVKTGKGNPPKEYAAQYVPPTGEVSVETGQPVAAPAPAPAADPVQAAAQAAGLPPEALAALQALMGNQG